ncbi:hypothetical protein ACFL2A_02850 [Thermodesulfobacteriota bacterium]
MRIKNETKQSGNHGTKGAKRIIYDREFKISAVKLVFQYERTLEDAQYGCALHSPLRKPQKESDR